MSWQRLSVVVVWLAALAAGASIVALIPGDAALATLGLALAGAILLAFLLQFTVLPIDGLVSRLVWSVAGAALLLACAAVTAYLLGAVAAG